MPDPSYFLSAKSQSCLSEPRFPICKMGKRMCHGVIVRVQEGARKGPSPAQSGAQSWLRDFTLVMTNFMCQVDMAPGCPGSWLKATSRCIYDGVFRTD